MLFQSISLFAFMASALAAPSSPPTYSNNKVATAPTYNSAPVHNSAPTYSSNDNPYTRIQTLHTEVYHWTALMNTTRDSYSTCTTDAERETYKTELRSQFTSLQSCVDSAQTYISKQHYKKHDGDDSDRYVQDVRDCVQEIKFTGEGLIPVLGHDVVAPLLIGVVKSLNGLLGVLLPLVGGLLEIVFELVANLLDLLF